MVYWGATLPSAPQFQIFFQVAPESVERKS